MLLIEIPLQPHQVMSSEEFPGIGAVNRFLYHKTTKLSID
jgi:hypothetical protein